MSSSLSSITSSIDLVKQFQDIQIVVDDAVIRIEKPQPTITDFPVKKLKQRIVEVASKLDDEGNNNNINNNNKSTLLDESSSSSSSSPLQTAAQHLVQTLHNDLSQTYSPAYLRCVSELTSREDPVVFDIFARMNLLGDFDFHHHHHHDVGCERNNNNNSNNNNNKKVPVISVDIIGKSFMGRTDNEIKTSLLCHPNNKLKDIVENPKFVRCTNEHLPQSQVAMPKNREFLLATSAEKSRSAVAAVGGVTKNSKSASYEKNLSSFLESNYETVTVGDLSVGTLIVYRHLGTSCNHFISITHCEFVNQDELERKINGAYDDYSSSSSSAAAAAAALPCLTFTRKHRGYSKQGSPLHFIPHCDACLGAHARVALYGCRLVPAVGYPVLLCQHCNEVLHADVVAVKNNKKREQKHDSKDQEEKEDAVVVEYEDDDCCQIELPSAY